MSGQIATKFTRRNYEINVEPFTLSEVIEFKRINNISCDIKEVYLEYCRYGGLPQIYYFENPDNRIKQLNKIYSEIIEKDVLPNKTINNYLEFKRILKFVCENIGNTFSSQTIFDVIDSENHANTVSKNTIYDYVKTMCNVLLINDVQKINVIGKELLKLNAKYYMQDIGIRNAILGNPTDIYFPKLLENIVYLELKSRGYSVNIGKIHRSEIDFIATKGDTCVYIQICEYLTSKEKIEQELAPFSLAKNHYRKIVIVGEKTNFSTYNGVEIIPICDFLLNWK
ncbi:hypothetical protein FACS189459_4850 [Bacilli bacterium]|nr:hypothetical protein FACS189459_4850 [Bacilli bacterium]